MVRRGMCSSRLHLSLSLERKIRIALCLFCDRAVVVCEMRSVLAMICVVSAVSGCLNERGIAGALEPDVEVVRQVVHMHSQTGISSISSRVVLFVFACVERRVS